MRTIEQHPFYLNNNKGILEAHTSEDEYTIPTKSFWSQVLDLFFN